MQDRSDTAVHQALRDLPSVDQTLRSPGVAPLLDELPHGEVVRAVRATLDQLRIALIAGRSSRIDSAEIALAVRHALYGRQRPHLRKVINATGIVLHTGLGRAPLAAEAIEAIAEVAGGYCNLELDLETGARGDRHAHVREALCELTGAADALVVNNNAAATFLALKALSEGRGAVVSRGQLVEIGGSYRMPDVMASAGCRMIEVGTTNRTRIADYERALTVETAVLLRVHTSNFRIHGFTEEAQLTELVALARRSDPPLIVIDDLGSGLTDVEWLTHAPSCETRVDWDEPTVRDSVAAGADLTLFSGDKLLGGPQAGIIVGRTDLIARVRTHPLMRALRPDKLTLAALEATLRLYRDPTTLAKRLPTARMLLTPTSELERAARHLAELLGRISAELTATPAGDTSYAGGGALPTIALPTWIVRLSHPRASAQDLAAALRTAGTPVLGRIQNDELVLDCRTVQLDEWDEIGSMLAEVLRNR